MSHPSRLIPALLLVWTSLSAAHPASATLTSFPEETSAEATATATATEALSEEASATEALSEEECFKILENFPEVSTLDKI